MGGLFYKQQQVHTVVYRLHSQLNTCHRIRPCFGWSNNVYKSLYHSALVDIHTQYIVVTKQTINHSNLTASVLLHLRLIALYIFRNKSLS